MYEISSWYLITDQHELHGYRIFPSYPWLPKTMRTLARIYSSMLKLIFPIILLPNIGAFISHKFSLLIFITQFTFPNKFIKIYIFETSPSPKCPCKRLRKWVYPIAERIVACCDCKTGPLASNMATVLC